MSDNNTSNNAGGSTNVTRTDQGSSTLGRLLVLGLVVGAAVVIVKQLPDLKRYLKMKQM